MAVLIFALPSPLIVAQGTAVFSRIDVAGNQRIEADSIRAFAGIEPGQPVTPEQLNLAVRNLFETGLFEDVTVLPEAAEVEGIGHHSKNVSPAASPTNTRSR